MKSERAHFNAIAAHYYDVVDAVWYDSGYYHRGERELVERCFPPGPALRLLDAGCGPGRVTKAAAGAGHQVVSVDISEQMLRTADCASPVQGDVRALPFAAASFDGAFALEIVEHLPGQLQDVERAVAELARIVRDGGVVVLEAPLAPHEELLRRDAGLRGSWEEFQGLDETARAAYEARPLQTWTHFEESDVVALLDGHGFDLVATRYLRVVPSGLIERLPSLETLDALLERSPAAQGLAREAIWIARRRRRAEGGLQPASPHVSGDEALREAATSGRDGEISSGLRLGFEQFVERERVRASALEERDELRLELDRAQEQIKAADEQRAIAEERRREAERELRAVQATIAVRLAAALWRLVNRTLPPGTRRREVYALLRSGVRGRLATPLAATDSVSDLAALEDFAAQVRSTGARSVVVLLSGTQLLESEGQRPTQLALEVARQGTPVVFAYWRWSAEERVAQDRLGDGIVQVPIDALLARPAALADAFGGLDRLALFEFPYPGFFELVATLNAAGWTTAYDVLDDWSEFHRVGQAVWYEEDFERHLITSVDAVFAINEVLATRVRTLGGALVEVVGNGLKPEVAELSQPRSLEHGEVTVGYFGHLTAAWFDWELVVAAASRRPRWRFYIIGYGGGPEGATLPPNVVLLGKKPQRELSAYAANWDVAMIPFRPEPLAAGADPIKTYEYLAMGLPVVTTGVHPPAGGEQFVVRVDGLEAFLAEMGSAAARAEADRQRARAFAVGCTWEERVRAMQRSLAAAHQRVGQKRSIFA